MRMQDFYRGFGKRLIDCSCAVVLLVVLSPLLLLIWLAVRWTLGAPGIFRQIRPGMEGTQFTIFKFRTMKDLRDGAGELLPDEERLGAFGKFLRSTSLDELPELWNVLRGEMSLVGPRPLLPQYVARYSPEQARRMDLRPGITGWAQVNGRNALDWESRFAMDVWYVDRCSFVLDLRILLLTVLRVIQRQGIHSEGRATMEEFKGSAVSRSEQATPREPEVRGGDSKEPSDGLRNPPPEN